MAAREIADSRGRLTFRALADGQALCCLGTEGSSTLRLLIEAVILVQSR